MPFTLTEQVQQALPLKREHAINRILAIMDGLCPTCSENKGFNPLVEHDCKKRAGHISATQVYDGECDEGTLGHWLGALQDYIGALQLLSEHFDDGIPIDRINHDRYVDGCRRAQDLIMQYQDNEAWNGWEYVKEHHANDYVLIIGMAYKLADAITDERGNINPVYEEMNRLGKKPL